MNLNSKEKNSVETYQAQVECGEQGGDSH